MIIHKHVYGMISYCRSLVIQFYLCCCLYMIHPLTIIPLVCQRVELLDLQPRLGPRSGGTLVTLTGSNLHVGSNATVTLGGRPCPVTARLDGVTCVTAPSAEPRDVSELRVTIDAANRSLAVRFSYTPGETKTASPFGVSSRLLIVSRKVRLAV